MTNAELNTFLDLEWNCAAFTPEETSVSAPLSPTHGRALSHWHPELQEFCPFWSSLLPTGLSSLKNNFLLHGAVPAGKISPRISGSDCYGASRLCSTIAKSRIIRLCGVGCWRVTGPLKKRSIRVILRSATGSGPSSIIRARGFNVPAGNSSRNRCGGASCTAPPTCCRIARVLTSSVTKTGVVLISFRN